MLRNGWFIDMWHCYIVPFHLMVDMTLILSTMAYLNCPANNNGHVTSVLVFCGQQWRMDKIRLEFYDEVSFRHQAVFEFFWTWCRNGISTSVRVVLLNTHTRYCSRSSWMSCTSRLLYATPESYHFNFSTCLTTQPDHFHVKAKQSVLLTYDIVVSSSPLW